MSNKVCIILNEWSGYPLHRKKDLGPNQISCGLGAILKTMKKVKTGVEFELHIIINGANAPKPSLLRRLASGLGWPKPAPLSQYKHLKKRYPFITQIHYRDNTGMDIGAYSYGLSFLREQNYSGDVLLMNSSVTAACHDNWLLGYQNLMYEQADIGLCGISMNSHNTLVDPPVFLPHVQSFFLYSNMKILSDVFGDNLLEENFMGDKERLIQEGEIGISQKVLSAGYAIRCSQFPHFIYRQNSSWTIPEGDLRFSKEYGHLANQA